MEDMLVTLNLTPTETVYGEKTIEIPISDTEKKNTANGIHSEANWRQVFSEESGIFI